MQQSTRKALLQATIYVWLLAGVAPTAFLWWRDSLGFDTSLQAMFAAPGFFLGALLISVLADRGRRFAWSFMAASLFSCGVGASIAGNVGAKRSVQFCEEFVASLLGDNRYAEQHSRPELGASLPLLRPAGASYSCELIDLTFGSWELAVLSQGQRVGYLDASRLESGFVANYFRWERQIGLPNKALQLTPNSWLQSGHGGILAAAAQAQRWRSALFGAAERRSVGPTQERCTTWLHTSNLSTCHG